MKNAWLDFLSQRGARHSVHTGVAFHSPEDEARLAQSQTTICDLSHLGLIEVNGDDAEAFLQGQLTNDVRNASSPTAQWSGCCSPKGRLLATFLLWRREPSYFIQVERDLRQALQKRLGLFVLRSKVKLADASETYVQIGLSGAKARDLLGDRFRDLPHEPLGLTHNPLATLIRLPLDRYQLITTLEGATDLWQELSRYATPVGTQAWRWLDIQAGIPTIMPATQDQFVPQMVNFEVIGGVSFQKGCYTGQEIVARTQHLGRIKRRMYRAHLGDEAAPRPADELYSDRLPDQASGMVVSATSSPQGGFEMLFVAQIEAVESGALHWESAGGPTLRLLPLPYCL